VYRNEEYGFEIKYPEEWGYIQVNIEDDADYLQKQTFFIHPKGLLLSFSNFPGEKTFNGFINNYIRFITKKSYNYYVKYNTSTSSIHKERYKILEDIYKNRNIVNYNIKQYNPGGVFYVLFKERPLVFKYIESNNKKYRGIAYFSSDIHHDITLVSHAYNLILMDDNGNIIDMSFVLDRKYFDDLDVARNSEIKKAIEEDNNTINMDIIKTITNKWEKRYKDRFNSLITTNNQFKLTINNINLIAENLQ
jgi:hypothetical protein